MASGRMAEVVRRLREIALLDGGGLSDGALLERYLADRDNAAFTGLVRIHGPMVLGVCRRVLRDTHDADDAFQATFLVLVRKGHAIVPRERVGPWLYGVAYRTSLKAKAMANRRRAKQKKLEDVPTPADHPEAEWLVLLDEEINRLPEKYRAPLVLCDLERKTRKQAAKQLGCPEGTVATRLQHARALVQKRLARHGLPVIAGAAAAIWGQAVSAAVPPSLVKATVKHASLLAAGASAGSIPLKIIALTEGVLNAMVLTKLKTITALLVLVSALGVGGITGRARLAADEQTPLSPASTKGQLLSPPLAKGGPGGVLQRSAAAQSKKDNDLPLPTGPAPVQAYVSLLENKLIVRMRQTGSQPITRLDSLGQPTTSYTPFEIEIKKLVNRSDLKMVLEVQRSGQRVLDSKEWPKAIKGETLALVVEDKGDFDLAHLRLIKEGTLVFVLAHKAPPVVPPIPFVPRAVEASVPSLPALPPVPAVVGPPPPLERKKTANASQDWQETFLPKNYDCGTVVQGTMLRVDLPLVNNSNDVVEITDVRVSCGCISARVNQNLLKPGQAGALDVVVETRRFSGRKSMLIFVHVTTNGEAHEFRTGVTAVSAPPTDAAKPQPGSPGQLDAQTIQQANRDLAALKFYANTGHRVSAAFYRDLIGRRYPDSLYSRQAAQLVRDMEQPVAPPKATSFIGRIIIVGNEYLPDGIIRKGLGFYPGQPFNGNELPIDMKRLHFGDIGIKLSLTVNVLNTPGDHKDIEVYVHEELTEATRTEMNKLQGTWTVVSTSFQGKAVPAIITEVTFQGNEITSKGKIADRGFFLLNVSSEPKQMRIIPFDGPADARTSTATYRFKDALLILRLPIDAANGNPNVRVVELTLKRKQF